MSIKDQLLRRTVKVLILLTVLTAAIYLSYLFFQIIIMLIIALLLSLIFNPLVSFMERRGVLRLLAVLIVFLVVGLFIAFSVSYFIPKIVQQMNAITSNINQEEVSKVISTVEMQIKSFIPFTADTNLAAELSKFFSSLLVGSINNISRIVSGIVSIVAVVVIVPFMTFFLLKDKHTIVKGLINLMPNRYFEVSYWVLYKIGLQLGRFVRGWIFDAAIVGFLVSVGLSIFGIQNSIFIGLVAAIGHLIPYFGPVIGGVPAMIISLIQFGDFSMFPEIALLFLVIYSFDNGFIQPNVFSKSTDIHPLMIIILILIGSNLLGIFGMLIAVPVATVIKTAARETYFGYKNYKIIKLDQQTQ